MKPAHNALTALKIQIPHIINLVLKIVAIVTIVMTTVTACQQHQKNSHTKKNKTQNTPAIFSPNWTITAELQNMQTPAKVASELHLYKDWVGEPALPDTMIDVGSRYQPNPELLSQVHLSQIIDSSWYAAARRLYGSVPVTAVEFGVKNDIATWQDLVTPTLEIAKLTQNTQKANTYIAKADQYIQQMGQQFQSKNPHIKKIAIIQFQDVSTLRLYAKNSLVHIAITKMGLKQATLGKQNGWGFATVPLADLTEFDQATCVVIIEPHTIMMQKQLSNSLIWQRLDYGNSRCIATIPPLWLYGGINSVKNLATYLNQAMYIGGKNTQERKKAEVAS